jgi:hypothetical protein
MFLRSNLLSLGEPPPQSPGLASLEPSSLSYEVSKQKNPQTGLVSLESPSPSYEASKRKKI